MVVAHGQMTAQAGGDGRLVLERTTTCSFDHHHRKRLDLPSVNTIIIHRADIFGLAQLYQLRGRVGRSKERAYAVSALPTSDKITTAATSGSTAMQRSTSSAPASPSPVTTSTSAAPATCSAPDQSGHIPEVGIELYQNMLEEAVAEARNAEGTGAHAPEWSPQISLGLSVLTPETYVPDLGVRLGLYRRLGDLADGEAIDAFAAELVDRFGAMPDEVNNLLEVVAIKQLCRVANVERIEAGPKGAVVGFRDNTFSNPQGFVRFISKQPVACKLRPDQRLVYRRAWEVPADRLEGVRDLVRALAKIAAA